MSTLFESALFGAAAARGVCYNRAGELLLPPDEALFGRLMDGSLLEEIRQVRRSALAGSRTEEPEAALGEIEREARRVARGGLAALISEYDATFGHGAAAEHMPYEAHYAAAHLFQQTQELADVRGFYRAFGVDVSTAAHERPDHVGIEMNFYGLLCLKEASAVGEGATEQVEITRSARRRFLAHHLGGFLPTLSRRVARGGRSAFYDAALRLATALVEEDCIRLRIPPAERRRHRFVADATPGPEEGGCFGSPLSEIARIGGRE